MNTNEIGVYHDDLETKEHIQAVTKTPDSFYSGTNDFPVGSILPIFPPKGTGFRLPKGWVVCCGQVIVDPDSPYKNERIPDLTTDIFLMGTDIDKIGYEAGANKIIPDGIHNHTGITSGPNTLDRCEEGSDKKPGCGRHTHQYSTSTSNSHDHGSENRPHFIGVIYIIKIK
jgi:hypothetical protein